MSGDPDGINGDVERTEPVTASHGRDDAGRSRAARAQPGAPVPEPVEQPSPELLAQIFKPPIDARRRAPASPFPIVDDDRPREGVRSSLPVMYGRRSEKQGVAAPESELSTGLGDPPAGYVLPVAARADLPSLTAMNRRFAIFAFVGGAAVAALAVSGVWWIVTMLL